MCPLFSPPLSSSLGPTPPSKERGGRGSGGWVGGWYKCLPNPLLLPPLFHKRGIQTPTEEEEEDEECMQSVGRPLNGARPSSRLCSDV